ncbi:STAS domain-containing protein [Klebsiella quasipneumoniae]|uniref:STAS domain-containing protein n=1 Tax=Klebsiella quasipneumoniae TaxID=1463165 RepID=UPI0016143D6F|nr:STAS domain-containing protein [Klebsiella quasipneumoniae]HBT4718885.1 STAS domain-containing protein [Klebsiella quasipneumoniae subsp. similipneumoniae]MCI2967264.1 STAS domain-containing protein [Klebsiella quasipneumoniae]MCU6521039.1 STAS domain-containing protein [Klebsiella quasipneumoniae]QNC85029.1 anti-sigma factor antagonist [Klebsiella quasipneumoniae]HBW1749551.1 STAS domain-containing protein [Klebsiella quasipneumoniae subsp. similipneumoniae]
MNVELHTEQGVKVIVPLVRRLDASVASAFKQQVLEALDGQTKNLVLDLSHVDFIDSSCLGALVSILKSVSGQGELVLCSVNGTIQNLFKLTRMDRVFSIKETRQDALNLFTAK